MTLIQTRRRFLAGLSGIGAAALLRTPSRAAEGPPETTSVRLQASAAPRNMSSPICCAPRGSRISAMCRCCRALPRPMGSHMAR